VRRSRKLLSPEARCEFEYHLDGLLEAAALARQQARNLKAHLDTDLEKTAEVLSKLDVEIFFHLDYHLKHLRRPFRRLHNLAYARLDEEEKRKHAKERQQERRAGKGTGKSAPMRRSSKRQG
jgi:hypothetical protein